VKLDSNDLVLLILGAPTDVVAAQDRIEGITRLEKLAFLLERESEFHSAAQIASDHLDFRAYHYGPYTRELYDAVDFLAAIGLITESARATNSRLEQAEEMEATDAAEFGAGEGAPYTEKIVKLTDKGRYVSKVLADRVGSDAVAQVTELKNRFAGLPLRVLLQHVYAGHEDMTTNSRIKNEL